MGLNLLYDTNTFIYYLNDQLVNKVLFDKTFISENSIYISSISRIELLSFSELSKGEKKIITLFLNEFEVIPVIREIEDMCIKIRKKSGIKINKKTTQVRLQVADGRKVDAHFVILDSLSVKGTEVNKVEAAVLPEEVNDVNFGDGLLGMSFLKRFNFKVDQKNNALILEKISR